MPKKTPSTEKPDDRQGVHFEEALGELEGIVAEMEDDRVPLEDLLKKYERGTRLLQVCQGHISAARERIEQISQRRKSGDLTLEPFDPQAGGSTDTPGSRPAPTDNTTPDDDIQLL